MLELGNLSFFNPWALSGLLALPVVWWIIRLVPTRIKIIDFPAINILRHVETTENTPSSTPLWVLILRLLMISTLIAAAAQPVRNPVTGLSEVGPILLLIDDDWAAAANWRTVQSQADALLLQAHREKRAVALVTTAASEKDREFGLVSALEARKQVAAIQPKPWSSDRSVLLQAFDQLTQRNIDPVDVAWLSSGIVGKEGGESLEDILRSLSSRASVTMYEPTGNARALALFPPLSEATKLSVPLKRAYADIEESRSVIAYDSEGRAIGSARALFERNDRETTATFSLPAEVRNHIERLGVEQKSSAGTTVLMDEQWRRRPVGIVSEAAGLGDQPLLSDTYYLRRALSPITDVSQGALGRMISGNNAVVILPDPGPMTPDARITLDAWVRDGGVLVTFAGPRLANLKPDLSETEAPRLTELLPVGLRSGQRALGGALSWRDPAALAAFDENSPFFGVEVAPDIRVRQQILAEPGIDLDQKTWARLRDGTPLITGTPYGNGWTILFHVGANAEWSSLPLSGTFVDVLKRVVELSKGVQVTEGETSLYPQQVLDGWGNLVTPPPGIRAVSVDDIASSSPTAARPPGFYGTARFIRAFNLPNDEFAIEPIGSVPVSVTRSAYEAESETDLTSWFLVLALVLFMVDVIFASGGFLTGLFKPKGAARTAGVVLGLGVMTLGPSVHAQGAADEKSLIEAINNTRLAYVLSGDSETDETSRQGLRGLTLILAQRTAVELADPHAVDVEEDELVFYPLLYWPITQQTAIPSFSASERINTYLVNGGTILFDMHQSGNTAALDQLRRLARVLDIPRLVPVPGEHVLTRSYYLLSDFPGRWTGGRVWVVPANERVNDGVSPIVAGGHHWAGAWALDETGQPLYAVVPGGERQREYAFRFGVNLVMYVLTGNYKGDQVHLPAILERLN